MRRLALLVSATLVAATGLAACSPTDDDSATTPSATGPAGLTTPVSTVVPTSSVPDCSPDTMDTLADGVMTIGTDQPAYEPWFVDDQPANKQGFEAAVAYAITTKLGYADSAVKWTSIPFNAAIAPGEKIFDFDINEFSITNKRKKAVDFSSPYYTATQAVVTTEGSKAAGATTIAELKGLKIGAQVSTTSLDTLNAVIAPTTAASVYNTNDDAKLALQNGQIDALVVDLPTAFYITSAELDNGVIIGQLANPGGDVGDQFGVVLDKGSSLTDCVSKAVDALKADGTLDSLQQKWLADVGDAPLLS